MKKKDNDITVTKLEEEIKSLLEINKNNVDYSIKNVPKNVREKTGRLSTISFDIVPEHENKDLPHKPVIWEQIRVIIDGDDIINQIGLDDDFHWGIASSLFLAQKEDYYNGKLHLGICSCTAEGDSDIVVDVKEFDEHVSWKIYHDRNENLNEIFLFEKSKYIAALSGISDKITQKEEKAHEYAYLLNYTKKDLYLKLSKKDLLWQ